MSKEEKALMGIKVLSVTANPDGSATLDIDITDAFKAEFKKMRNLKRFSKKEFQKFVIEVLELSLEDKKELPSELERV